MSTFVRKRQPDSVEDLNPNQVVAVLALAGGQTTTAAAAQAGVSRQAVYEWRQDPAFRRALQEMTRHLEAETYDLAIAGRNLATRRLMAILNDPESTRSEVIRAAALLLRAPVRSREEMKEYPLPSLPGGSVLTRAALAVQAEMDGEEAAREVLDRLENLAEPARG